MVGVVGEWWGLWVNGGGCGWIMVIVGNESHHLQTIHHHTFLILSSFPSSPRPIPPLHPLLPLKLFIPIHLPSNLHSFTHTLIESSFISSSTLLSFQPSFLLSFQSSTLLSFPPSTLLSTHPSTFLSLHPSTPTNRGFQISRQKLLDLLSHVDLLRSHVRQAFPW